MSIEKAYNTWSEIYDHNVNKTRDLDQKVVQEILDRVSFSSVLELGCGTGKNTAWLAEKADTVVAVDFSKGMLEKAKEKIENPKVTFIQNDINEDWNVESDTFDLITINLVLEHIELLSPIFEKAQSALVEGGHLFICELHPFRQYKGSGAKYEEGGKEVRVETFIHHISDFLQPAISNHFQLVGCKEWFDEEGVKPEPRLVSFLFKK
ncbi:MAG: class I SAM-dependent methyltransferase [Saprospiraceae bacterium]|nr:class I SAM-dependent methyltransferase [Saprospiraceae bacterium]